MTNMNEQEPFLPNKSLMIDEMGRYITQSLFLEINYTDHAMYTLKEDHYTYNGKLMPSIKRLYLEMEDPTEYEFATTYFCGWKHWQRLLENKAIRKHIDEWREELEYKLRAKGIKRIILEVQGTNGMQASKWLADRGWSTRAAGRPSKSEVEQEKAFAAKAADEFSADIVRLK